MPAIYALCDETGRIRYVGKANDPATRLKGHLRETRRRSPLYDWLAKLRRAGHHPTLHIIERCASTDWQERERFWIAAIGDATQLLNIADGGDEPACSRETRADNGRLNAAARVSTPERRRIWFVKRQMGELLQRGYVSEAAKAKLRYAACKAPHLFGEWATL